MSGNEDDFDTLSLVPSSRESAPLSRAAAAVSWRNEIQGLDFFLSCQPIFARNQDVAAVELQLEYHRGAGHSSLSELEAALSLVLGSYRHVPHGGRMRSVPAFIRVPHELLVLPELPTLPRAQYIIEISVNADMSDDLIQRLRQFAGMGYCFALADYSLADPRLRALLGIAQVIRLNVAELAEDALSATLTALRPYRLDLLASGITDRELFQRCRDAGFHYFQGNFLATATPVQGKKISNNKQLLLQLLAELQNPNVTTTRLEQIAIRDADFTYRILKIVNAAALGVGRTVDSISHAFALLGTEEIRRWVNLLLIDRAGDKPEQLTRNMLVRGRMCELLAQLAGRPAPTDYFITGLLSQLDVLMDMTMVDLMSQVPLQQAIKDALLDRAGALGDILRDTEYYEQARFSELRCLNDASLYEVAYRHSTTWANHAQLCLSV
ncbi:MAG: HDOD domain-containing protein [Pseudomonas sp.]